MDSTFLPESVLCVLFPWRQRRLVEQMGGELARQCRADLWRRIFRQAANMTPAELRGYARAHAGGMIAAEAERILERRFLAPELRCRVLAAGVDQVVSMAVRDVLSEPPVAVRFLAA